MVINHQRLQKRQGWQAGEIDKNGINAVPNEMRDPSPAFGMTAIK
jgi:hypothetical protein